MAIDRLSLLFLILILHRYRRFSALIKNLRYDSPKRHFFFASLIISRLISLLSKLVIKTLASYSCFIFLHAKRHSHLNHLVISPSLACLHLSSAYPHQKSTQHSSLPLFVLNFSSTPLRSSHTHHSNFFVLVADTHAEQICLTVSYNQK